MDAADAAKLEKKRVAAARRRDKAHEYYLAHKEEFKERERIRYEKNKEFCNQYSKKWYDEHKNDPGQKEKMYARCKAYRERNKEKCREYERKYRRKQREERGETSIEPKKKQDVELVYPVDIVVPPDGTVIYSGPVTLGQDAWA